MFDFSPDGTRNAIGILLPALVLFAGVAISRTLSERALASLDGGERDAALGALAGVRRVALMLALLVVVAGMVTSTYWLGIAALVAYFAFVSFEGARRLGGLVPARFVRRTLIARAVVLVALVTCLALFWVLN